MKSQILGVIVLFAALGLRAEEVKPPSAAILATTDDGRRVVLMPDGKWSFVDATPAKPEIKSESGDCRGKVWSDLLTYFSAWDLSQSQKDSFLLKTDWTRLEFSNQIQAKMGLKITYRFKVSVLLVDDCSMKIDTYYQREDPNYGWKDQTIEELRKIADSKGLSMMAPPGPVVAKKVLDYDTKLKADLAGMAAKYQQSGKAAVPSEIKP